MKQKNKMLSHKDVKTLFETRLTQLTSNLNIWLEPGMKLFSRID